MIDTQAASVEHSVRLIQLIPSEKISHYWIAFVHWNPFFMFPKGQ